MKSETPPGWSTTVDLGILREHYATKADLAKLETEVQKMENRLLKWLVGLGIAAVTIASSAASAIQRFIE